MQFSSENAQRIDTGSLGVLLNPLSVDHRPGKAIAISSEGVVFLLIQHFGLDGTMNIARYGLVAALVFIFCSTPCAAQQDTVVTYDVTGSFTCVEGDTCPYGPLSFTSGSTITLDITSETFVVTDLAVTNLPDIFPPDQCTGPYILASNTWCGSAGDYLTLEAQGDYQLPPNTVLNDYIQGESADGTVLWTASGTYELQAVPEPATSGLLGIGLLSFMAISWRRNGLT